jgi:hypothetical protein
MGTTLDKLTVEPQKRDNWCWAAVTTGIDHFYNGAAPSTQCSVAAAQQGAGDCCKDPSTSNCDRPWFLEKALFTVNHLDGGPIKGQLKFSDIAARLTIEDPKPVCARIGWEGDGGHFVAIKGFQDGTQQMLLIADPSDGDCLVLYQDFVESYHGFGSWTHYYLTDKANHVDHI